MKSIQVLTLSIVVLFVLAPTGAQAQSWSFSIGSGYHHHGCYHCYDPFWYGPQYDYIYVAPAPIVRREIRYVEPIEETTVETRVLPPRVMTKQPVATSATAKSAAAGPLQIWNSAGRKSSVAFLVDGQEVALADGQSHTFYGGGSRTVEYDRGNNFGTGRAVLTEGEFEFVVTSRGWDLVRRGVASGPIAARPSTPKNELPGEAVQR
jgi:hypothetical protein